jgi:hypothetical protein
VITCSIEFGKQQPTNKPKMPIDYSLYPKDWTAISLSIRHRAGYICECTGECGTHHDKCQATNGQAHPITRSKVILTVAHLGTPLPDGTPGSKHDKMDVRPENLKAMCQRCHLLFDLDDHIQHARNTRNARRLRAYIDAGQLQMGI